MYFHSLFTQIKIQRVHITPDSYNVLLILANLQLFSHMTFLFFLFQYLARTHVLLDIPDKSPTSQPINAAYCICVTDTPLPCPPLYQPRN